ncbi:MAG: tyrosine-type recombinase/integrase [Acidimicrobiales bacterium]
MEGPLAPFAADYAARLEGSGYTASTVAKLLRQAAHLSRWMQASRLVAADLAPERIEAFLAERRASKGERTTSHQGLAPLLELLAERAALAVTSPPDEVDDETLAGFRAYLLAERGLAVSTADAYLQRAHRFVAGLAGDRVLASITTADVTRAVRSEASRVSAGSVQYFVAGLRAFLRFCFLEELVGTDLSPAALAVSARRRSLLPRGIGRAEASALLGSCDRQRAGGRRDYAVLVVLVRLGLRASEVAGLRLEDVDWRAGELVVRGKGNRSDRLPLPVDVGEAVVAYLRHGRPRTTRRELFLHARAPFGPLSRQGICGIVRTACVRAGVEPVGPHRLRHTLACQLLAAGAGLPEIGEVLRHRGVTATAIYARADLQALRRLARPWPGGDGR